MSVTLVGSPSFANRYKDTVAITATALWVGSSAWIPFLSVCLLLESRCKASSIAWYSHFLFLSANRGQVS